MIEKKGCSLEGSGGARSNGGLPEALVGPDPAEARREEDAAKLQPIHAPHCQRAAIPVRRMRHRLQHHVDTLANFVDIHVTRQYRMQRPSNLCRIALHAHGNEAPALNEVSSV